jgi:signal transduction histidine kinase
MNIRARITIIFFLIVIVVVSMISISIYSLSSQYRTQDFYRRLKSRATNSARLLVEYDELNADLLQRMERGNPANLPNQHVTILDNKNEILYQSAGAPAISIDSALVNRIRKDLDIAFTRDGLQVVGFLFTEGTDTFTVVGAAMDVSGLDMLDNLRSILLTIFVLSLITVSPLAWFFAGTVVNPISRIVNEVDAITENNLDLRLDEGKRHDELGKLALTFNKMIARLQDAFISQKNFIANASHEIKTPITVMTGEIEVALLQRRTPEYYEKVLRSVLRGVRGMNKLFTQLLLLAHTSNGQSGKNFTSFRIDDIMWSVKDELTKVNPAFNIDIEFDSTITDDSLVITGDEGLLKVVLNNLI